jgi:SAM-dependent methyltransferase
VNNIHQQPLPNWSAGGFDWLQIWKEMHYQERQQGDAATHPGMKLGDDYYESAADRFVRFIQEIPQPDRFMAWLSPHVQPGDVVLDIGAGSGRYLQILTSAGCSVIALEPSLAMLKHIQRDVDENSLASQVTIRHEFWPTQHLIPCDIAIAVQVLDAVQDVGPFLLAMQQSARKLCAIVLAIRHPSTPILHLWEAHYGSPRSIMPGAYECLNALAQLGITANLQMFPRAEQLTFASMSDAIAETCFRLRLPHDQQHIQLVTQLIEQHWIRLPDDRVRVPYLAPPGAIIWWDPMSNTLTPTLL